MKEILTLARDHLARGQPQEAAVACRAVLAVLDDADARHVYARTLAALGHLEAAAAELEHALELNGEHLPAMADLGMIHAVSGNYSAAQTLLMAAHDLDSRPAEVHFYLGVCALGLEQLPMAEIWLRGALTRNRRFPDALNNLGVALDRQGRLVESAAYFREAVALNPSSAAALHNLGDVLLRLGHLELAADAFRRQVALDPSDALAHRDLGHALMLAGESAAAVRSLTDASNLDRNSTDAVLKLSACYCKMGQPAQAIEILAAAAQHTPRR